MPKKDKIENNRNKSKMKKAPKQALSSCIHIRIHINRLIQASLTHYLALEERSK